MKALAATDLFALRRGAANYKVDWSDMNQVVSVGTTPPASPQPGALWLNTEKGVTYAFDGTYWIGK